MNLKVFFLPIYENYSIQTYPTILYKYKEITLIDCWHNKQLTPTKRRRYKPINFKKLYRSINRLKKQYTKLPVSNWICRKSLNKFSKNTLNSLPSFSYLLRATNNSRFYRQQRISYYQSLFLKGFTLNKENVIEKKKVISKPFSYSCKLHKKVLEVQKFKLT